jgi:flagellar biosynthesis/type III secretory pathway protein FliH
MAGEDDDRAREWSDAEKTVTQGRVEGFVAALDENTKPHDVRSYEAGHVAGYEEGLAKGLADGFAKGRAEGWVAGKEATLISAEAFFVENEVPGFTAFLATIRAGVRKT